MPLNADSDDALVGNRYIKTGYENAVAVAKLDVEGLARQRRVSAEPA